MKLLGKIIFVMRHVLRILIATTKRFALMENVSLDVQVTTIALKDQNVLENHVLLLVVEIQVSSLLM